MHGHRSAFRPSITLRHASLRRHVTRVAAQSGFRHSFALSLRDLVKEQGLIFTTSRPDMRGRAICTGILVTLRLQAGPLPAALAAASPGRFFSARPQCERHVMKPALPFTVPGAARWSVTSRSPAWGLKARGCAPVRDAPPIHRRVGGPIAHRRRGHWFQRTRNALHPLPLPELSRRQHLAQSSIQFV